MNSQILKSPLPYLALFLAHSIWGINFVVAKITLHEFPPMSLAFLRFALASLFLAPFFYAYTRKHPDKHTQIDKKDLPKLIAIGIFIITLNITFFFEGIKRTTVIDASVLFLVSPMLSVLLGWWFLKEKVYLINLGGIFLGLMGALIIIGLPQIITGNFSAEMFMGNILITLSSISWVIGAIIAKGILKKISLLGSHWNCFSGGYTNFLNPSSF